MDPTSHARFTELRKRYFSRTALPDAHLTLFHKLPGGEQGALEQALSEVSQDVRAFAVEFSGWRNLGRGWAMGVHSPDLNQLREGLRTRWMEWLGPQDRQPFRAHITVANKLAPEEMATLTEKIQSESTPSQGHILGLTLHRYLGGPWERVAHFPFRAGVDLQFL